MKLRTILPLTLLAIVLPVFTHAATIYINPADGAYGLSDTFIAEVRLDNAAECVNAIHVDVRYPVGTLRAVDFSKGGSILSLWVEEPVLDTEKGIVTFSGGIPGGYCGRIQGDPVLSNVLGKIIFTVVDAESASAEITVSPESKVYLNDGAATLSELTTASAVYSISKTPLAKSNPWLVQVGDDTIPPDEFAITVESTRGVFRGNYYAVFSTIDKQSGLDHYEIFEDGSWKRTTSPHELEDQYLLSGVQIKAIDKAGNERLGTFVEGSQAPRAPREIDYSILILVLVLILLGGGYAWFRFRKTPTISQVS